MTLTHESAQVVGFAFSFPFFERFERFGGEMDSHGFAGSWIHQALFLQVYLEAASGGDVGVAAAIALAVPFPRHLAGIRHTEMLRSNSTIR